MSEPEELEEVSPGKYRPVSDKHQGTIFDPREMLPPTATGFVEIQQRKRIKYRRINLQGWLECGLCGNMYASLQSARKHEMYYHKSDDGLREMVTDAYLRIDEINDAVEAAEIKSPRLRTWGPAWLRKR